jgi:hypothetical protein
LATAPRVGDGLGDSLGDGEAEADAETEADGAPGDTEAPGGSSWYDDAFFVPVVALSDNRNTPSTSPARRVRRGPGRFIRAFPEASLLQ